MAGDYLGDWSDSRVCGSEDDVFAVGVTDAGN